MFLQDQNRTCHQVKVPMLRIQALGSCKRNLVRDIRRSIRQDNLESIAGLERGKENPYSELIVSDDQV